MTDVNIFNQMNGLLQWFSSGGDLVPQAIFGTIWRHIWWSQLGYITVIQKKKLKIVHLCFYVYIHVYKHSLKKEHISLQSVYFLLNLFTSDYVPSRNINLQDRVKNSVMYIGSQNFANIVDFDLSELLQKGTFVKIQLSFKLLKIIEEITTNLLFHQVPVAEPFLDINTDNVKNNNISQGIL